MSLCNTKLTTLKVEKQWYGQEIQKVGVVIGSDFDASSAGTQHPVRQQGASAPLIAFREMWLTACGTALTAIALAYTLVAWIAVRRRIPVFASAATRAPQATVLKALCGAEHGLYEHLRSFCDQDHA